MFVAVLLVINSPFTNPSPIAIAFPDNMDIFPVVFKFVLMVVREFANVTVVVDDDPNLNAIDPDALTFDIVNADVSVDNDDALSRELRVKNNPPDDLSPMTTDLLSFRTRSVPTVSSVFVNASRLDIVVVPMKSPLGTWMTLFPRTLNTEFDGFFISNEVEDVEVPSCITMLPAGVMLFIVKLPVKFVINPLEPV